MNTDDPKFTAHVLGEMDDLTPAERAEIAALLAADADAAAEAEETRAFADRLHRELQGEESVPLTAAQRAAVLAANVVPGNFGESQDEKMAAAQYPPPWRRAGPLALAASVLLCATMAWKAAFPPPRPSPGELAFTPPPPAAPLLAAEEPAAPHPVPEASALILLEAEKKPVVLELDKPATAPQPSPMLAAAAPTDPDGQPVPDAALPAGAKGQLATANVPRAPIDSEASAKTKALLGEAQQLADTGRYDLAYKRYEQVLSIDPDNKAARAGEEAVNRAKSDSSIASYNETRSRAVLRLDQAWANPVRRFDLAPGSSAPAAGSARGAGSTATLAKADARDRYSNRADRAGLPQEMATRELAGSAASPDPESGSAESNDFLADNAFLTVAQAPLSTFSIDVDTASYAIVRRFLNEQRLPPKGAVRIEELINYFTYDYPQPQGDAPFSATMEVAACPWTPAYRLVRIGLKGREIAKDKRPASNLVFLIDVSGSMQPANKLPLLKQSLGLLIDQLGAEDQVAMVVYAGSSGTVLEPTRSKAKMRAALAKLESGGSTNGASGVQLAYELAEKSFIKGGTNRVILATDGDWNVGITNPTQLFELIAKKAKSGVFLTVLGYGMDNLKDSMLVKLADKGNGNYGYIDTLIEAKKLLADELSSTLVTIAKDVKIQVEFNPAQVAAYRLIGYEKRLLAKEDFNDDTKDAGEIGAGHTVTALYEIVPAGGEVPQFAKTDELKYQAPMEKPVELDRKKVSDEAGKEMLTLKLRYKAPDGDVSKLLEFPLTDTGATWEKSSRDFRFAAAVAGYGMLLRDSPHKGAATWDSVRELAVEGKGEDATGYRAEFLTLLEKAKALAR